MNRVRLAVVIGVAILLALVASGATYRYLSEKGQVAEAARLQTVGIAVAAVDIPLGARINPNQVAVAAWPKEHSPKDAFLDLKTITGRMVMRDFLRGEPIIESKLVPSGTDAGILSLKVPAGMRAFSVKVNEVVGVGGFIVPNTRVDVLVTTALSQQGGEQYAKIVLEDIRVLAAGQAIEQKDNKPVTVNTVTLAVTPEEAEKLALASNDGRIQLVLRNFSDAEKVMTTGIDKARLLASYRGGPVTPAPAGGKVRSASRRAAPNPSPRASAPAPKRDFVVEIIRGSKRSEEKVE